MYEIQNLIGSGFMAQLKHTIVASVALFVMLGFVTVGIARLNEQYIYSKDKPDEVSETAHVEEKEVQLPPPENYVLKIEDGIVVVFNENDMTRPIIVTDIYAGTLRHYDRAQLTEGVVAVGEFELQSMLEDYSS